MARLARSPPPRWAHHPRPLSRRPAPPRHPPHRLALGRRPARHNRQHHDAPLRPARPRPPASPDDALLSRRVWTAQLRALFPWLEEQRWLLLDHAAHLLIPPFTTSRGTTVESAADLDLGEITWHLRHSPRRHTPADYALSRLANDLADARTELAHRRPLSGSTIQALIQAAFT